MRLGLSAQITDARSHTLPCRLPATGHRGRCRRNSPAGRKLFGSGRLLRSSGLLARESKIL
jgi:hypothetical protein